MNLIFALLFSAVAVVLALGLVLMGKEAPLFATAGLGYLAGSLAVLWGGYFFLRRSNLRHPRPLFFLLGVVVLAAVVPLFDATDWYDGLRDRRKLEDFRHTEVFDLSDEMFFSLSGHPLGVRLRYSVRVPRTGGYSPSPRLLPEDPALERSRALLVYQLEVEPRPDQHFGTDLRVPYGRYQAGRVYRFTADLIPAYVVPSADNTGFCFSFTSPVEEDLARSGIETRFLIDIDGTGMSRYTTGRSGMTANPYQPALFFQGAVAEGADRPCHFDARGNLP